MREIEEKFIDLGIEDNESGYDANEMDAKSKQFAEEISKRQF